MKTLTPEQKDNIRAQVEDCTAEIIFQEIYGKKLTDEWYGTYDSPEVALSTILKDHYNNRIAADFALSVEDWEASAWLEEKGFELTEYNCIFFVFKISGDPIPTRY